MSTPRNSIANGGSWRRILGSLVLAVLLEQLPWSGWALIVRPDFVLVAVLFWALHQPERIGFGAAFTPSATLAEPYVVVSADVVVADDTETATHLASTYGHWVYSIRKGGGAAPYPDPDTSEPLTEDQEAVVKDRIATQFVGDADTVAEKLDTLARVTGADELVVTSVTHRHADRLRSPELLAKRWGL